MLHTKEAFPVSSCDSGTETVLPISSKALVGRKKGCDFQLEETEKLKTNKRACIEKHSAKKDDISSDLVTKVIIEENNYRTIPFKEDSHAENDVVRLNERIDYLMNQLESKENDLAEKDLILKHCFSRIKKMEGDTNAQCTEVHLVTSNNELIKSEQEKMILKVEIGKFNTKIEAFEETVANLRQEIDKFRNRPSIVCSISSSLIANLDKITPLRLAMIENLISISPTRVYTKIEQDFWVDCFNNMSHEMFNKMLDHLNGPARSTVLRWQRKLNFNNHGLLKCKMIPTQINLSLNNKDNNVE